MQNHASANKSKSRFRIDVPMPEVLGLKRYRYAVYGSSIAVLVVGSLGTA